MPLPAHAGVSTPTVLLPNTSGYTLRPTTSSFGAGLRRWVHPRRGRTEERLGVDRRYPEDPTWSEVAKRCMTYSEKVGTPELLASLALEKISRCPFPPEEIDAPKQGVSSFLQTKGLSLERRHEDRRDVATDFRYLSLLLQAVQDPEISLGDWARGQTPSITGTLSEKEKRKWRLPDQGDPSVYLEEEIINYRACIQSPRCRSSRGQILKARGLCPIAVLQADE